MHRQGCLYNSGCSLFSLDSFSQTDSVTMKSNLHSSYFPVGATELFKGLVGIGSNVFGKFIPLSSNSYVEVLSRVKSVSTPCKLFFFELVKRPRFAVLLPSLALDPEGTPELPATEESNRGKKCSIKRRVLGMHETTIAKHISIVLQ